MSQGEPTALDSRNNISLLKGQWKLTVELCLFNEDYNPLWLAKTSKARFDKLKRQLRAKVADLQTDKAKLKALNEFFFVEQGFAWLPNKKANLQNSFLPYVLTSKTGPNSILMLLYASLAEKIGLKVQVSSARIKYLLKVYLDDHPVIIDIGLQGKTLQPFEIVELINKGFDFSLRKPGPNALMIEYLSLLKTVARKHGDLHLLSQTHSYLMKYQPFNLKHLSERAVVAYQTGDYKTAVEDIRSYFLYKSPEVTNFHLKKIYKVARKIEKGL